MKNIHEFSPGTCLSTNLLRSSLAVGLLLLLAASPPATAQPTPGGSPDPPCTPPASGIVSWWPAEGNANDIIGANNGVLEGAVSFGPGEVGEAFLFNNTNADVRIPASASLNVGAGSGFTVEAWVNSLDVSQFQPLFEWNDRIAFGVQFYISQDSGPGSLYANVTDSGGGWHQFHTSSAPLTNNVFQHVALTYDQASGTGTIYCNGLIVAQQNLGSFTPLTSLDLYMGRPPATAGVTFSLIGLLDEPSLYDRALSSNEIAAIYQAGSGGKCPPTPMAPNVPVITSFTPPAGQTGAVVNITGLNFSPVASNNIVRFGAVQAVVSAASATNLIVTVPVGATFAPITETVNGLTAYADAPFLPTFPGGGPITSASLGPQITLPTGSWPASVTIADLDGDGKPDLVIPDSWGGDISIYQNIGTNGTLSAASFGPRIVLPGILSPFGDGANPTVLAVADIDGDGRPDIIAVYAYSDLVAIYRNLSSPGLLTSNSFAAPVYLPGGNGMYGLAVQDLNDDGKPDIVTGNSQDNTISLFQNQSMVGNIAFAPRVNLAVGTQPQGVAIGDVDGDGMPDLAVANSGDGTISIYRNLGLGGTITTNSFAPQVVFPAPTSCAGLALGDVDGDGKLDLVVSGSSLSSTIAVLRNTATPGSISTNSFAPAVDFPLGGWGTYCALGDINGDGKPDIAVVSQLNSLLSVFQNESTPGSFTNTSLGSRLDFAAGWNPLYVAIGDLNGDGRPDIVFVNLYDSTVSIYQNLTPFGVPPAITQQPTNQTVPVGNTATFAVTATGSLPLNYQWNFNSTNLLGATNATLTLTNVQSNQSGNYTVLVTNLYGSILSSNALLTVTSPTNVPVIISFTPPLGQTGTVLTIKGLNFSPIAGSNIVYFGAMRAVVSTASATNLTVTVPVGATFAPITETVNGLTAYADAPFLPTFPGGGSISSSSLATQFTLPTGNGPGSVLIADLDGDGKPDLIIADSESGDISIYQNVSTNATLSAASFRPRIVLPGLVGSYHNPYAMAVADIDGDGRPDIVAAYGDSGQVAIYRNLSSPGPLSTNSFAAPVYLQGGNFLLGLAVQDLNGDGKPDVVIGNFSDNTISIFQNQSTAGNIAFAPRVNLAVGTHPEGVAIGDVDGDGLPDLAVANSGDATISIFRNLGLGGTLTTNSFAPPVVFATPATCQEPAFGNVDGDGKLDLVVACSSGSSMLAVLRNTATPGSITTNSFARAVDFPLLSWGQGVALGDINGDGKPDIAVVSGINTVQNSALSLFQNQSTPGSFTSSSLGSRVDFVTGNDPGGVAIGDLNGDGRPDVVCVNYYDATISIYQNLTPFGVPPAITQQPTNQTVPVGNTATFAVTATGSLPLSYQWNLNSTNLAGATNSTLTLTNVQFSQSGNYSVLVTNLYGSILSSNALLTVTSPTYVPVIISFTPPLGQTGTVVSIKGLNFSPIAGSNIVYFGAVRAVVSTASATNLTVTVPVGATFAPITETVNGLTAYADAPFLPTFLGTGPISTVTLGPQITLPTGNGPGAVAIADLDGDGKPDLVIGDAYSGDISLYQNLGTNGTLSAASFGPRIVLPGIQGVYANPSWLVVADVDGDGKPDIIATYGDSDLVAIYRNLSSPGTLTTNSFAAPVYLSAGNDMTGVAVQDLNGDGKPEIVTANCSDNTISIYQNQSTPGNLAFAPALTLPTGPAAQNIVIADLDGDGRPDVMSVNNNSGTTNGVSIFRNTSTLGNISFAPRVDLPGPIECYSLVAADIDGDGRPDLVFVSFNNGEALSVYRNLCTPGSITTNSFAPRVDFPLGAWGNSVAMGDVNGDGKPDVAVVTQLPDHFYLFQNTATAGGFATSSLTGPVGFAAGWNPNGVAIGDLSGDGRPDIVFANSYNATISIYQNLTPFGVPPAITQQPTNQSVPVGNTATFAVTATGSMPMSYQWNLNSTNLAGATNSTLTLTNVQFSQSGNYSVLVTNLYGSILSSNALLTVTSPANVPVIISFTPPLGQTGTVVTIKGLNFSPIAGSNIVYFGAVRAVVSTASATNLTVTVPVGATFAPITETVNGLTAYADAPFLPTFPGTGPISTATLGPQITLPSGSWAGTVVVADLDGDGKPDLIIGNSSGGYISIYQNIGTNGALSAASFGPQLVLPGVKGIYADPSTLVVADIDGDGKPDIIASYADSDVVAIYRNLSSPGTLTTNSFAAPVYLPGGNAMYGLAVQALNGDGKPDIVTGSAEDNTLSIFQNQSTPGNIAFAPRVNLATGNYPVGVAIGDMDGDGFPDLAVANSGEGTLSLFRNLGLGGTITTNSFAPPVVLPTMPSDEHITFGDVDGDGKLDMIVVGFTSEEIAVYRNLATPGSLTTNSFAPALDFPLPSWGQMAAFGDLNGDGKPDLAVVSGYNSVQTSALSLFQNESTPGSFTNSSLGSRFDFVTGNDPGSVAICDLNGDGRPDVVCMNYYDGTVSIYRNLTPFVTPGLHYVWNPIPSPRFADAPFAVTVQAENAANTLATNFTGTVMLATTNGVPVSPGACNFSQGVWTGTVTIMQTGTNLVLEATDNYGENGMANPINVAGLPALATATSGGSLVIGWPVNPSGFVLETSPNLMPGSWVPVSTPPVQIDGQNLELITPTGAHAFYRLRFTGP